MADEPNTTPWHQYFGFLVRELLTPVGLTVHTELPVSPTPPKIDVLKKC